MSSSSSSFVLHLRVRILKQTNQFSHAANCAPADSTVGGLDGWVSSASWVARSVLLVSSKLLSRRPFNYACVARRWRGRNKWSWELRKNRQDSSTDRSSTSHGRIVLHYSRNVRREHAAAATKRPTADSKEVALTNSTDKNSIGLQVVPFYSPLRKLLT